MSAVAPPGLPRHAEGKEFNKKSPRHTFPSSKMWFHVFFDNVCSGQRASQCLSFCCRAQYGGSTRTAARPGESEISDSSIDWCWVSQTVVTRGPG